ncbi:MAG: tetratricopeptide repeat protein [Reichenbachiella sp.]|uniref:tetratricopeptide repeat protein n=1 Tax=Reichenbachiella sp. TaxID=2184521 RepID=UPI00296600B6|nr:tetratricopeptide repeat protein [Reichenbachiella sp.]MDW3210607.1 tetratricopeptide repeat protein [Reichenbachiella sp.]
MNTSKLFVLTLALLMSVASFAQKGSVTKADAYLAKNEFENAKAEIDVAITIEKNALKSKTWFVRGKIYQAIATSTDEAVSSLDADALDKSVEAYNKVLEMDKETSPNNLISNTNLDAMWGNYINIGGTVYGEEKYGEALAAFEKALKVKPTDSVTLLYAGVAAQQSGDNDKTLDYYYQMVDANIANGDVISTLIYLERTYKEDNEKALDLVRKAKELYPTESKFGQEEISLLLTMDKVDEARTKLEAAIEEDPTNVNLHLNLGVLYDNLGSAKLEAGEKEVARENYNKAKEAYLNAIKVDGDNYVANFNTGVIYVNLAKEYYDEVRDMNLKDYDKYGPAKLAKADKILKEGLPYMEKATTIQPDDIAGLKALQQMYTQLKMMDKAEAILDKVDALEAGQ